jgi:hypothetical protein
LLDARSEYAKTLEPNKSQRARDSANRKMSETQIQQREAYEELQRLVSTENELQSIGLLILHPDDDYASNEEPAHGAAERHPFMAPPVQDTEDLFIGSNPVNSIMDGHRHDKTCAICTEHLSENELGKVYAIESEQGESPDGLIRCGHKFHRRCIDAWIKVHMNCPLCKGKVKNYI